MLQLTQRDSNDFEIMFKQLDDIEKTPQFSSNCFWSMQKEYIQAGKKRWHPRLVN